MNQDKKFTTLALFLKVEEGILNDDLQLNSEEMANVKVSVPRKLNPLETPFVVMSATHWNAFQEMMDRLNVREEFKSIGGMVWLMPKSNIRGVKENEK